MKKPFLTLKSLCPLPDVNSYSKLTIKELSEKDPEYFLWMVNNLTFVRWADDVRRIKNKLKK